MGVLQLSYSRDPATGQILFDSNGYPVYPANPDANTYAQLQARIQNEVLGSPSAADIQNAIQDAILSYERNSFWFNDMRQFGVGSGGLATVQGQEFYSATDLPVLGNYPHISKILIVAFGNRYTLDERTPQWIDDQSVSTSWAGLPTDWCWQAGALRLYPVPNGSYPLIIDGITRFAPLVNPTDFNCWTNEAEPLIRFEGKRLLFVNITRDADQAAMMERELFGNPQSGRLGLLAMMQRETMRRTGGPGRIRANRGYM